MSELQHAVATAADAAGTHSTAPALLVQAVAALGRLAQTADQATESGRRPFRVPHDWGGQLSELAWLIYLLADQTGVDLAAGVQAIAEQTSHRAVAEQHRADAEHSEDSWF